MNIRHISKISDLCKKNALLLCILLGVAFGAISGLSLRPLHVNKDIIILIAYPGEIFMRALKLLILPFIICCVIIGSATLNISKNKRIATRTITYFVLTSIFNVMLGLSLALLVHPGDPDIRQNNVNQQNIAQTSIMDGFLDMGRNLIPENIFQSFFQQTFTANVSRVSGNGTVVYERKLQNRDGTNMIGVIFFSLMFGCILGTMGSRKQPIIHLFTLIYEVMQKLLIGAIWLTPIGVASIICSKIISIPNLLMTLQQLGLFVSTVVVGFLFYQLIIVQLIYYFYLRKNPFKYYIGCFPALATAFATASKSASLPIAFQVLDEKLKMNPQITRFVLPIGTINMDGSALYLSFSMIFLSQLNNTTLTLTEIISIGLVCTISSMSSAAIPSAAIVLVVMICSVINLPTENVALLLAVDWFVDRFRTMNNLLGDCYTVAIVQHLSKKELEKTTQIDLEEVLPTNLENKTENRTTPTTNGNNITR